LRSLPAQARDQSAQADFAAVAAVSTAGLHLKSARVAATVDTGDMTPANRLYDSLGFTEAYRGFAWRKLTR